MTCFHRCSVADTMPFHYCQNAAVFEASRLEAYQKYRPHEAAVGEFFHFETSFLLFVSR